MPTYRKKRDEDIWHWCKNCSKWPKSDYKEVNSRPESGEFCRECLIKEKMGRGKDRR